MRMGIGILLGGMDVCEGKVGVGKEGLVGGRPSGERQEVVRLIKIRLAKMVWAKLRIAARP